jgi:hypothetical protein
MFGAAPGRNGAALLFAQVPMTSTGLEHIWTPLTARPMRRDFTLCSGAGRNERESSTQVVEYSRQRRGAAE